MRVGIAVVESGGRFLIGWRRADGPLAGAAEFPGGKCLEGEPPPRCAERECREETGLEVVAGKELAVVSHRYPHGAVELHFWRCRPAASAVPPEPRPPFRWVPRAELATLHFPEANAAVVKWLTAADTP